MIKYSKRYGERNERYVWASYKRKVQMCRGTDGLYDVRVLPKSSPSNYSYYKHGRLLYVGPSAQNALAIVRDCIPTAQIPREFR